MIKSAAEVQVGDWQGDDQRSHLKHVGPAGDLSSSTTTITPLTLQMTDEDTFRKINELQTKVEDLLKLASELRRSVQERDGTILKLGQALDSTRARLEAVEGAVFREGRWMWESCGGERRLERPYEEDKGAWVWEVSR